MNDHSPLRSPPPTQNNSRLKCKYVYSFLAKNGTEECIYIYIYIYMQTVLSHLFAINEYIHLHFIFILSGGLLINKMSFGPTLFWVRIISMILLGET